MKNRLLKGISSRSRKITTVSTIALFLYYYFLWQFDHHIAPLVWALPENYKIADGWWLEKIIGEAPFYARNFYNICMIFLMFMPLIVYVTWSYPEYKKAVRKLLKR